MTIVTPFLVDAICLPCGATPDEVVQAVDDLQFCPDSFDYQLWTDGSGHQDGYGSYAAIWQSKHGSTDVVCGANYGQTVNRNELTAMLDGLSSILAFHLCEVQGTLESATASNPLAAITDADRITVAWYTDRQNLALSMLWNESGTPVYKRNTDRDLWARAAMLTRHMCVVPYHARRNKVANQAICDKLCGVLRKSIKDADGALKLETLGTRVPWVYKSQKGSI